MKITYISYTCLLFLFTTILAHAQQGQNKNILEQRQEKMLRQWDRSSNAAGLLLDKPLQNSAIDVGYGAVDGNYRRPQESASSRDIDLHSDGNLYLGGLYLQGHFSYTRNDVGGAEYNTSLIDPLRNMPYIIADTNDSDWVKQHYDLGFKLATRRIGTGWYLGLETNYKASSGAKQRDIRAENAYYALELKPGVVYAVQDMHAIGANFLYRNFKEESHNSNVNVYIDQGFFALSGLGNAIDYVGSGRSQDYKGDAIGAGLQYQYNGNTRVLFTANYSVQAEDANIGFTAKRPVGSILEKNWRFGFDIQRNSDRYSHILRGYYLLSNSNGIEYVNEYVSGVESDGWYTRYQSVRAKFDKTQAVLAYDLIRRRGESYNWKARLYVRYDHRDDRYLIPLSTMSAENLRYGLSLHKSFDLVPAKHAQLSIGGIVDMQDNLSGAYHYQGDDAAELTVTDLEQRNFAYYTSDYTRFTVPVIYSQRVKPTSNTQVFIKASGQYLTTDSHSFDRRRSFHLAFGATF